MQIKSADDIKPTLDALRELSGRVDVDDRKRQAIELEMRLIKAGANAERNAAFEIEFYTRDRRDMMTIHGLRIDYNGRVASIDHLIVNSQFQVWVCESKSVAEVVEINEHGEWANYFRDRPKGIASPIEQNRRHVKVLQDVFATEADIARTVNELPRQPEFKSLVIVSKKGRVDRRAAGSVVGIDTVVKADQAFSRLSSGEAEPQDSQTLRSARSVVSHHALETLARQLAALHAPVRVDWAARFGVPPEPPMKLLNDLPPIETKPPAQASVPVPVVIPMGTAARAVCSACRTTVSRTVVDYCRTNASLFGNAIYCIDCQRRIVAQRLKTPGQAAR
jgi:hypothetical protein